MVSKGVVLQQLPAFENKRVLVTWRQSVNRLMDEIVKAHEEFRDDYSAIDSLFDTGDIYDTCKGLWDFCKYNLKYVEETEREQSVKSPAGILQNGEGVDCKHYSLFIGGVLDAIKKYEIENDIKSDWDWCYRFACYDSSKTPCHVFVVVTDKNKEIWVDPVLSGFDRKKQPTYYIDKQPVMAIYKISGASDDQATNPIFVTVDKKKAEESFLKMVNGNIFMLRDLFKKNPQIYNGRFRDWYISNGFDFNHLNLILSHYD